jgi:hypothetical protein
MLSFGKRSVALTTKCKCLLRSFFIYLVIFLRFFYGGRILVDFFFLMMLLVDLLRGYIFDAFWYRVIFWGKVLIVTVCSRLAFVYCINGIYYFVPFCIYFKFSALFLSCSLMANQKWVKFVSGYLVLETRDNLDLIGFLYQMWAWNSETFGRLLNSYSI